MFHRVGSIIGLLFVFSSVHAEDSSPIQSFGIQENQGRTYARVQIALPDNFRGNPQLIPQDANLRNVVLGTLNGNHADFYAEWVAGPTASLILRIPTREKESAIRWQEKTILLDRKNAEIVPSPKSLYFDWGKAMMDDWGERAKRSPGFGFYPTAQMLMAREIGTFPPKADAIIEPTHRDHRWLYQLITGGTAVAESLQHRNGLTINSAGDRTISIRDVQGITIREHPWKEMMKNERPAVEPLARLTPHDFYYARFVDLHQFCQFAELVSDWGTNLLNAAAFSNRDARLRSRYERQLAFPTQRVREQMPKGLLKDFALIGSDPYFLDGTDITAIFHVENVEQFYQLIDPFRDAVKREYALHIQEGKEIYQNRFTIESLRTPLREVSQYRTTIDSFVIISNSPVAIRKVIDTHLSDKSLSNSLDFQYMRTCFRADDPKESGFAFLSDAFIRRLVSPADKIKQSRRIDALARLHLLTNAMLYAGWRDGKLPRDRDELCKRVKLTAEEFQLPDGPPAQWDVNRQLAVSSVYQSLHFATPLIELPIDKISQVERNAYSDFRDGYTSRWRQFFDPIGFRYAKLGDATQFDVYVLPLIGLNEYDFLRQVIGGGLPHQAMIPAEKNTVLHIRVYLSPFVRQFQGMIVPNEANWLGDSLSFSIDDGPAWKEFMELVIKNLSNNDIDLLPEEGTIWTKIPFVIGVQLKREEVIGKLLDYLRTMLPNEREITRLPAYRNHVITMVKPKEAKPAEDDFTWYHVLLGDVWYVGFTEASMKARINRYVDQNSTAMSTDTARSNATIQVQPNAGMDAKQAILQYLEWQIHRQALQTNQMWLPLHRAGVIQPTHRPTEEAQLAMHWLGYEPVSPDQSMYRYDRRLQDVVNTRHHTSQEPNLRPTLALTAPLRLWLDRFSSLRVEMRFREDGMHSTIILQNRKVK